MILFLKLLNVLQNMISILYGGALSLVTHMTAVSVVLFFFFFVSFYFYSVIS